MPLFMKTAVEISKSVREGKLKAQDAVKSSLAVIKKKDSKIGAFLEVFEEEALARAASIDARRLKGEKLGALAGVPVAIKDNLLYSGHKMTCASKILEGYISPYSATAVEKLIQEDAVIIGRTNMDEFAMGSSCENSAYKKTHNPSDPGRVPGGSSGGSAAAVAAGMVPVALGSDTGGSIRQPASFCGVVGVKPTYGRVSRWGLVAFASSLDQIGPFAMTVEDSALALSVISGHDAKDSTSVNRPPEDFLQNIGDGVKGLKIGLPKEYFVGGVDPEVEKLVRTAAKKFEGMGAVLSDVSLPHTEYAVPAYYILASSEASANLARFDGIRYGLSVARNKNAAGAPSGKVLAPSAASLSLREVYEKSRDCGFGEEVKRRIMLGTCALSAGYYDAYYGKAARVRTLIRNDFRKVFETADILLAPTSPTPAFRMGEKASDPIQMYLSDVYTIPCNLAGIAGISVPCGKTAGGLYAGMQLLGRPFEEAGIFRAAACHQVV